MTNHLRHVRRSTASKGRTEIAPGQPLNRRRRRLNRLLILTAGAKARGAERVVVGRLVDLAVDVAKGRGFARVGFFPRGFRLLQVLCIDVVQLLFRGVSGANAALGAGNIGHLIANLADQLRLLESLLLFLFVEDRGERLVGVLHVAAELIHILNLTILVADDQRTVRYRRVRGAAVMPVAVRAHQQAVSHIPGKLAADAAPGAHAHALVFHFEIGAVFNIAKADGAGIETVFISGCRRANHRPVELGMLAHGHVVAAFTGEDPGLFNHRVVVAVHLVAADVDAGRAGHGADAEAPARAGVLLFRVVAIAVLLGGERQVAANVRFHGFAAHLRPGQGGVTSGQEIHLAARVHGSLAVGGAVAALVAFAAVDAGGDVKAKAAGAHADANPDAAALALVFAVQQLGVLRRAQVQIAVGGKGDIVARLQLAAFHGQISVRTARAAAGGDHAEIASGVEGAALSGVLFAVLGRFRRLAAVREANTHRVGVRGIRAHGLIQPPGLRGLYAGERRLHALQCLQAAAAGGFRLLRGLDGAVQRAADGAGERQRQPGGFLLHLVGLLAAVVHRRDIDVFTGQRHVLTGHQIGAAHRQAIARPQAQVAIDAAHRAARLGGVRAGISGFDALGADAKADPARA